MMRSGFAGQACAAASTENNAAATRTTPIPAFPLRKQRLWLM